MTTDNHQSKPTLNVRIACNDLKRAQIICVIGENALSSLRVFCACAQAVDWSPDSDSTGGPGVGKGTHCARLAQELGFNHVSVGDLLRAEAKRADAAHKDIVQKRMEEGLLVPNIIVQGILEGYLVRNVKQGITNFLVDGFPRSLEQAADFNNGVSAPISYPEVSKAFVSMRLILPGLQS